MRAFLPHLESPAFGRVEHQEALEEVLAVGGHVEGDAVLPSQHALAELLPRSAGKSQCRLPRRRRRPPARPPASHLQVLPVEGQRAADERVEDDAQAPDVHLGPVVFFALEEFGRGVRRRAAEGVQLVAQRELVAEAKVGDLDVPVGVQQQVLRLKTANGGKAALGGGVWGVGGSRHFRLPARRIILRVVPNILPPP